MSESLSSLHSALAQAILQDLPDIHYTDRNWAKWSTLSKDEQASAIKNPDDYPELYLKKVRRPRDDETEVYMFPQTWGSTALGYGGIGGSAMTTAYTVVISSGRSYCVYFGPGRLAYKVDISRANPAFFNDLKNHTMASVSEAKGKYSA